ncbi:MAG: putative adenosine monophosphate-protein transferase y4lH [Caulobacter sp.]|nr:putative adenosine monophosphate-protein transferase y4lH [Caulobacter sp.]
MSQDDPYVWPGSRILRNRLGLKDEARFDYTERELVLQRIAEGIPTGRFDLAHLRAIHRHLFQDIYDWAGEIRTVEIAKQGHQFQFRHYIETGMADVHRRLTAANFLKDLEADAFAAAAGEVIGDTNYVHPFREGNGRAQLQYLSQLADQAGHPIDLTRFDPGRWLAASKAAHNGDYGLMADEIGSALRR